jgi:hypothetical protein
MNFMKKRKKWGRENVPVFDEIGKKQAIVGSK